MSSEYHASGQPDQPTETRRRRLRRAFALVLIGMLLLTFAAIGYSLAMPSWAPDGSRPAWSTLSRALLVLAFAGGTVMPLVGGRELVLALAPISALGSALKLLIVLAALVAIPLEAWLVAGITGAEEPGTEQRWRESEADWDD